MNEKKYKYSEIFGHTFQGEGAKTGIPTVWLRFWGCNFECSGFGQANPLDRTTWNLDYQTIDLSQIKRMEDLPVFNTGCDSSYSWAKKFAHLAHTGTVQEICDKIESFMISPSNPEGKFLHPASGQWIHMAFTGGEPMLNQNAIVDIMLEFARRANMPKYVTVETNGTQEARSKFIEYLTGEYEDGYDRFEKWHESFYMRSLNWLSAENYSEMQEKDKALKGIEWFWSVSPKLFLSGEVKEDALKPEIIKQYNQMSRFGQLKYVSDGSDRSWQEVEEFTKAYREVGVQWPVWIMPVGATVAGQDLVAAKVAEGAIERGYNVAARVHTYIFNNAIGK